MNSVATLVVRAPFLPLMFLSVLGLALLAGCQTAGNAGLRFLNLIGITQKPLAIGLTPENQASPALNVVDSLNPFPPYDPLIRAMGKSLGRAVGVEPCLPLQVQFGLDSGWYDLAIVTPAHYSMLSNRERFPVLAVPLDEQGRSARPALLIVPVASDVRKVGDLVGKSVAFGPREDSRLHYAALELLDRHGLRPADLALDLLPLPGSLKHLPDGAAVAEALLTGGAAAGFIDQDAWERFPEAAPGRRANEPARERFRIIAETVATPRRVILASPKLQEETSERIVRFLLSLDESDKSILKPLKAGGFARPTPELLAACAQLSPVARMSTEMEAPGDEEPGDEEPGDEASGHEASGHEASGVAPGEETGGAAPSKPDVS